MTPNVPSLSLNNPRYMASVFKVYSKSVFKAPTHINVDNIEDILSPLEDDLKLLNRVDRQQAELLKFHSKSKSKG